MKKIDYVLEDNKYMEVLMDCPIKAMYYLGITVKIGLCKTY